MSAPETPDFAALLTELREELHAGLGELRKAFVEAPEPEPQAAPDEAAELSESARRAGLSVGQYQAALKAGRRSQFKEEFGDTVRELLDELLAETPAAEQKPAQEEKPGKPAAEGGDEGKEDTTPVSEHWSTRRFSELFK